MASRNDYEGDEMTSTTATDPMPRISALDPRFREPRTIAEMLPARRAELAAHPVPDCPLGHGPTVARPLETQTYEQMYCGIWYDCAPGEWKCMSSVSYTSRELAHYHGHPYNDGKQWFRYDGGSWASISDEEAKAFWAELAEWRERWDNKRFGKRKKPKRLKAERRV